MLTSYLKGIDYLEDLAIDGRLVLGWILWKNGENAWDWCIWLRI